MLERLPARYCGARRRAIEGRHEPRVEARRRSRKAIAIGPRVLTRLQSNN